jgi:hypothetical protein
LLFKFALGKCKKTKEGLEISRTHQLLVCADDVHLLDENINKVQKNTESLLDAGMEVGLQVNTEKFKNMFMSLPQRTGQNHCIEVGNKLFENVAKFIFLGKTVINKKLHSRENYEQTNFGARLLP